MTWVPMASYELSPLASFLEAHEEKGLNASALLFQGKSRPQWPPSRTARFWKIEDSQGKIRGVITLRNQTTLIPILPGPGPWPNFPLPIPPGKHFSLLGPWEWTSVLAQMIPGQPYKFMEYLLMTGPNLPRDPGNLPEEWEIHPANPQDRDLLFPLQAAYEKEEVVFSPEEFEPWACYHNLKILLEKEKVWYIQDGEFRPKAKGGTNAQGKHWSQLGGIYTDPPYRRQGISRVLVQTMVNDLLESGHRSSLFVKKHNVPAMNLYTSLGFESLGTFIISYYCLIKT